jgi:hypothetical protein
MALRKVESEGEARRWLAAVEEAGVELGEWTRANGVDGRSLSCWKRTLQRRGLVRGTGRSAMPEVGLVELVPREGVPATAARYALDFGRVRLEFGDEFHDETLRRVLRVVGSC